MTEQLHVCPPGVKRWVDRKGLASYLSVSLATVGRLGATGMLKRYQMGGLTRYDLDEVDALVSGGVAPRELSNDVAEPTQGPTQPVVDPAEVGELRLRIAKLTTTMREILDRFPAHTAPTMRTPAPAVLERWRRVLDA